jgi:hypothetical protein
MGFLVEESPFAAEVRGELRRARGGAGHPPFHSAHEAYAVILEELDEFKAEVWKRPEGRDPLVMLKELAQVGAMAQRAAEDLLLIDG